jgi:hypothetical protein
MSYETTLIDYINLIERSANLRPLILGGVSSTGGGEGGPPGGFIGYLPQWRIAYDETEDATLATVESGASLLDNLNHIRYLIATVSGGGGVGHIIQDDGVSQTQRSKLNFTGVIVSVIDDPANNATIVNFTTGSGSGDVSGPATNNADYLPQWNGANSKLLKNGLAVVTTIGNPGADTNIPTEQAVREVIATISGGGGGDVTGPSSAVGDNFASFNSTTGKLIKDSGSKAADFATAAQGVTNGNSHDHNGGDGANIGTDAISANAITLAKMATQAADTVLANQTAGSAVPTAMTVAEQTLIGRITGGHVDDLTATQVRTLINVADGATANTKASSAEVDTGTDDAKFVTALAISGSHNVPHVIPITSGNVMTSNGTDWISQAPTASGGGHTIQDEGVSRTQRSKLNFVGPIVSVTDDAGNDATVVTISGVSVGGGHTIQDEGVAKTQRTNLNFVGSSVIVTDDVGNDATIVTISGGAGNTPDFYVDQIGGTGDTYGELTGARNSVNTTYTVSQGSYVSGTLVTYLNGQLQTQGSSEDWEETSPSAGTFDFIRAPEATDEITAVYGTIAYGQVSTPGLTSIVEVQVFS